MRFPRKKKVAPLLMRQDALRKARAAAPTLRVACPEAARVRVELEFEVGPLLAHAPQTLSIFPPAKAHFVYACPFGDCDGVYDLNEVAFGTFKGRRHETRGMLTCTGCRSRDGRAGNSCELGLSYSITVDTLSTRREIGQPE